MTSGECFENKWFYMKYIGKYLSVEILLTRECISSSDNKSVSHWIMFDYFFHVWKVNIFFHSGHVGCCTASLDTILKLDTLVMIQTKVGFHWSSTFRGDDFWKTFEKLRVRWAKNLSLLQIASIKLYCYHSVIINVSLIDCIDKSKNTKFFIYSCSHV
jgi:hypothetical protein